MTGAGKAWGGLPTRGLAGLVAAVAAAGALLAQAPVGARVPEPPPPAAEVAWPQARRATVPGALPDGTAYSPAFFLDERASVGPALDPRGGGVRLVLRSAGGAVRVLRRPPDGAGRSYAGFARAGTQLVWAESVTARDGSPRTELWRAGVAGGAARRVTADTGWATFANSEHDIVFAAGRLYWTASAPGPEPVTEVRSVPLEGGPVRVTRQPGTWALAGWPWLVSSGGGQRGPARIRDLETGRTTTVDGEDGTLDRCGPAWCRLFVLSGDAPVRSVLMRPDGSDRRTASDSGATAAIADVAVLDRFEVLSGDSGTLATAVGGQRLLVYDLKTRGLVRVAEAASRVSYRDGVLWWSTSAGTNVTWHTLDLRSV
ncbi:hypothetical protein RB614_17805 [Phytohabitans sp. ZYX-F-186]|uniref:Lipoprotein LpqB beta-propeller domain-containing protein n=1 Tax=Phytohabitans maris TaxID=3071409 RepID=A0ABU0ZH51_9ACTN|nr:hypothetical protein [Phytohabitans sp. ZYX-F-186]MDQ7906372.1 hypothetical protein [Phytohabitans sp. ZYX-F-186]